MMAMSRFIMMIVLKTVQRMKRIERYMVAIESK